MELEPRQPVPVFPLPNAVLFPHAVMPLHVFELRYRTMVRDALSGERLIAMALLKPGWERDDRGSTEFHRLGCLGRVEEVEWLPDDCYDLRLLGLTRVRLGDALREYPYRAVRVHLLPEEPCTEDDPLVASERHALLDVWRRLVGRPGGRPAEAGGPVGVPFPALVNGVCMAAPLEPEEKLALLALDNVIERGHRVRELVARRLHQAGPAGQGEHN